MIGLCMRCGARLGRDTWGHHVACERPRASVLAQALTTTSDEARRWGLHPDYWPCGCHILDPHTCGRDDL